MAKSIFTIIGFMARYILSKECLLIILLFYVLSCKINENILENEEELKVISCNPKLDYIIKKGSFKYVKLEQLIKSNSKGWEYTPATYVSGLVVVGKKITLNFLNGIVIITYKEGTDYKQYYKEIEIKEYEFFLQPD